MLTARQHWRIWASSHVNSQSSRWHRLAAVPQQRFTRWLTETRAFGER